MTVDVRSLQKPIKEGYRADPTSLRITLRAQGEQTDTPLGCSVDLRRPGAQRSRRRGHGRLLG